MMVSCSLTSNSCNISGCSSRKASAGAKGKSKCVLAVGEVGCLWCRKHSSNEQGHVEWEYTYIYICCTYFLKRAPSLGCWWWQCSCKKGFQGYFSQNGTAFYASQPEISSRGSRIYSSWGIQTSTLLQRPSLWQALSVRSDGGRVVLWNEATSCSRVCISHRFIRCIFPVSFGPLSVSGNNIFFLNWVAVDLCRLLSHFFF